MNKVLTRLQALRDKAAQFKQVVDSAPATDTKRVERTTKASVLGRGLV